MFVDMKSISANEGEHLRLAVEPWISELMATGQYVGWLIEYDGTVVAGGGVFLMELGPGPGRYRLGRGAHVANIYTEPAHRRRGIARSLMNTILMWCEANAIDQVTLSASDEGRPLYESLGFRPTSDMRLEKRL